MQQILQTQTSSIYYNAASKLEYLQEIVSNERWNADISFYDPHMVITRFI